MKNREQKEIDLDTDRNRAKWETGHCTTDTKQRGKDRTVNRQQSPAHSSSVSPGTFLSDI